MRKRSTLLIAIFLFPAIVILTQCISTGEAADPRGEDYAGAKTCMSCHKNINNTYIHTAHYLSSAVANSGTVHGSFTKGRDTVRYNDHAMVQLSKTDSGLYQTSYINKEPVARERMAITMGGVKGESYLYWKDNILFEMPVSYDNEQSRWIVSPGYDTVMASFDRAVNLRCMECHASYAKAQASAGPSFSGEVTGFDKGSIILSIDCERCHGPGKKHAEYQANNPSLKEAKYITDISKLTKAQKTDMCGTCHSGTQTDNSRSIFDFKPGDKLTDYKKRSASAGPLDLAHLDVHGDQLDMLKTSKCFISSNMDCSSCHNPHQNQHNQLVSFVAKCDACHQAQKHNVCKLTGKVDALVLRNKCIECHMPALPSKNIINEKKPVLITTHHIAVYPDVAKKLLSKQ